MKKMIALASVVVALFAFGPTTAEAGYRSKRIGTCQHCHGSIYSYYKPLRYSNGYTRWSWVPSYHTKCAASYRHSQANQYRSQYYSRSHNHSSYSSRYYSRGPSFSIRFGSGRSCR